MCSGLRAIRPCIKACGFRHDPLKVLLPHLLSKSERGTHSKVDTL